MDMWGYKATKAVPGVFCVAALMWNRGQRVLDSYSIDSVNKLPPSEDYVPRHTRQIHTALSVFVVWRQPGLNSMWTHTHPSLTHTHFMSSFEKALIVCILMMAPGYELPDTADWSSITLMVMNNGRISSSFSIFISPFTHIRATMKYVRHETKHMIIMVNTFLLIYGSLSFLSRFSRALFLARMTSTISLWLASVSVSLSSLHKHRHTQTDTHTHTHTR